MVSLGAAGPLSGFGGCLSRGCVLDFDERKRKLFWDGGGNQSATRVQSFKKIVFVCYVCRDAKPWGFDEMEKPAIPLLK